MTILPNTVYEYDYQGSRFLTRTESQADKYGYWANDIQKLSGFYDMSPDNPWEFEYFNSIGTITIIQCYDQQNYPEYYI